MSVRRRANLRIQTFRWIEAELRDYPETQRHLGRVQGEVAERGMGISYEQQSHRREASPEWSDPTGARGTWLAEDLRLRRMTDVVHAIDAVYARLAEEEQRFVELLYWKSRSRLAVCDAVGIDVRTYHRWRNKICSQIARLLGAW